MSTTQSESESPDHDIEEMKDSIWRLDKALYNTGWKLRMREELDDGIFVNVYEVSRHYGGPEEGGWWYDAGHVVHSFQLTSYNQAQALAELLRQGQFTDGGHRHSMAQREDDYSVRVEGTSGADFPEERPHYE